MNNQASSPFSRRHVLGAIAAGTVAAGAFASPALGLARKGVLPGRGLHAAGFDTWSRQVGTTFTVRGESGPTRLTLASVAPLNSKGARPAGLRDRAFHAVFTTSGGALPKGNRAYAVQHPVHGPMSIFFDPAGESSLTAVFN